MAVRLARILLDNRHKVTLGSRRPSRSQALARVRDPLACTSGTYRDAADQPIVLPALFVRDGLFEVSPGKPSKIRTFTKV